MPHDDPCDNYDGVFDQWQPRAKPKLTELEMDVLQVISSGGQPYALVGRKNSRVISQAIARLQRKGMAGHEYEGSAIVLRATADGLEALERVKGSRR